MLLNTQLPFKYILYTTLLTSISGLISEAMEPICICDGTPRGLFLFDNFSIASSMISVMIMCTNTMDISTISVLFTATAILFTSIELSSGYASVFTVLM